MSAIEISNLSKSFKDFKAVHDLSLTVPEGKIYGFLGKNGAGKTTTIRTIMGLMKPDSGKISLFGKEITTKNRVWASRQIGCIVETPGFYENLTARGNLAVTRELYGADVRRIEEVLELVGLTQVGKKKVKNFSLGMKQRLGIANALLHSPKILILDEPTNGLDPSGIKDMRNLIKALSQNEKITIMISSHILSEVEQVADTVGIIDQGRLMGEMDIKELISDEQSFLLLEVSEKDKALELLKKLKLNYLMENHLFKILCKKELNPLINKELVSNNINVLNLTSVQNSLEDKFFSLVGDYK